MNNTIRLEHQAISLEAFNVKASLTVLTHTFPNFVRNINTFLSGLVNTDPIPYQLVEGKKLVKALKTINYTELRGLELVGPKGLKGTYLDYINALDPSVAFCERLSKDYLQPFSAWLGVLLTNPLQLAGTRGQNAPASPKVDVASLQAAVEGQLEKGSSQTRYTYGRLVQRNSDWDEIIRRTNDVSSRFTATDRRKTLDSVMAIVEQLEQLIDRMKTYPEEYKPSGVTAKLLADHCYALGQAVEFYSLVGFWVQVLSTSVDDTVTELEKRYG